MRRKILPPAKSNFASVNCTTGNKTPGGVFSAIYFTKHFYEYLGNDLNAFGDPAFTSGMIARGAGLNDPEVSTWEEGFRKPCHAMVLLAHDDLVALGEAAKEVCDALNPPDQEAENLPTS